MSPVFQKIALWVSVGLILVSIWSYFSRSRPRELPYRDFLEHVEQGRIGTVSIQGETITGTYSGTEGLSGSFKTSTPTPQDRALLQRLREKHVGIKFLPPAWTFFMFYGLLLIMFFMWQRRVMHFVRSACAAAVYVWLLWYVHGQTPMPEEVSGFGTLAALRFKLFDSGPIPFAILWTFLAGVHYLVLIWQHKFTPLSLANIADREVLAAARQGYQALVAALNAQRERGYYGQRLYQLAVRWSQDQDPAAINVLKDDLLAIDEEDFALPFTAITWCEAALPLWGFLGTVVGIGDAVVAVAQGVRALFGGTPLERVLDDLNRGFQGMGVAFDTTFLGLAGLIMLGMGHIALKKGLAVRLAQVRSLFSDVVFGWPPPPRPDPVTPVVVALTGLEARLQAVEEALHTTERRATLFRETVRTMAERVITEAPDYAAIRKVLFKPVVIFQQVGEELADKTAAHVSRQLRRWRFVALSLPWSVVYGGVVVIETVGERGARGEHRLLSFDLAGPYDGALLPTSHHFAELFLLSDRATAIGKTVSGELVSVGMAQPSNEAVLRWQRRADDPERLGADDRVFQVLVDKQDLTLIIYRLPQSPHFDVAWVGGGHRGDVGRLSETVEWTVWAVHAPSATLVAAGKSSPGTRWQLLLAPIRRRPVAAEEGDPQRSAAGFQFTRPRPLELPPRFEPKQLVPLASDTILLLDTSGKLHYWDTTRPAPLPLAHDAWEADPTCTIRAGTGGWFAVVTKGFLSMWRAQRGGYLTPYEGAKLAVGLAKPESFRVTADGRYLFAIADQTIATWEFPRYPVDDL